MNDTVSITLCLICICFSTICVYVLGSKALDGLPVIFWEFKELVIVLLFEMWP
jgi:hypothetical protein